MIEAAKLSYGLEPGAMLAAPRGLRYPTTPLEQLARMGSHLFDVDVCVVLLPGEPHWMRTIGELIERKGGTPHRRFGQHTAVLIPDTFVLPALKANSLVSRDPGIRFVAHAQLIAGDERSTLEVFLGDREPHIWTDERASLFGDFLAICNEILNAGSQERELLDLVEESKQLRRLATVDHLTGLWNRNSIFSTLDRELERCFRERLPISVIVADLDHFKNVNDRHGHLAGDSILEEVGRRLRRAVRNYDAVGRIGGEEFLIVMSSCDEVVAASVAERIHDVIRSEPMPVGETRINVTISQGLVTYSGEKRMSPAELFEKADKALYLAKAKGRDGIQRDTDTRARH